LSRAQILTTDITTAMLDRYTEEALIRISTSSLILMDDKGPAEFISNGLGLLSEHLQWSASERFGGLLATIKLSGVRLPRPCPPQWLVKPRTPADHNNDEPEMVLDEVPLHENGADSRSSVSSSSTWMGGEVDKSWQIPEKFPALLPLQLGVTTPAEQAAEYLPSHSVRGIPLRPVTSEPPPKLQLSRTGPTPGEPSSSRRCTSPALITRVKVFSGRTGHRQGADPFEDKNYPLPVEMAVGHRNRLAALLAGGRRLHQVVRPRSCCRSKTPSVLRRRRPTHRWA
jgi:hypothetical protein